MADEGNNPKKGGGVFGSLVQAESMIQLALALPAGCVIGWFFGMLLDHHFHTDWIQVIGIIVGAIAGFVQIFTTASKFMKRGR
jgi:F0F1-type ATP synthase assembly protein I